MIIIFPRCNLRCVTSFPALSISHSLSLALHPPRLCFHLSFLPILYFTLLFPHLSSPNFFISSFYPQFSFLSRLFYSHSPHLLYSPVRTPLSPSLFSSHFSPVLNYSFPLIFTVLFSYLSSHPITLSLFLLILS